MLTRQPSRLRTRIGLIVLVHAAILTGIMALFVVATDPNRGPQLYRLPEPEKVAAIATAFEHTPPDTHADLVTAFTDQRQRVTLLDHLPALRPGSSTEATAARYRDALGGRPFRLEAFGRMPPADFGDGPVFTADEVRVVVALGDGHALAIEHMAQPQVATLLANRKIMLMIVAIIGLIIVLWLTAQSTRPIERLVRAVRDDTLDTLAPRGPREIVELTRAFQDLRAKLRSLLQARTRMLAAIAHDYRTYLTRLELRCEFIDDPRQRALAANDLEEMRELLSDTLTFAREAVTDGTDGAICDLREELSKIVAERAELGQQISIVGAERAMRVKASHVSVQRMLANLLDNALRYGGGRAWIRIQAGNDRVHIAVEDEGPGVPGDSLERLLEPFERLETSRARHTGGVGLGLSIVQALAQRYHGDLMLENRAEGGFRAILTLHLA
jgi:two-component system osmolarity sensor histidine kinase EnvZ